MSFLDRRMAALLILPLASFLFLYRDVISKLIHDWSIDENYSHGFLVIPIALYLAWERRHRFAAAPRHPSVLGLVIAAGGMGMLLAGVLGSEVFTTEVSMLATITGSVLFLFGWSHFRVMLFPISFLILMIPLPAIIFNQITFPLQLLASRFGESALVLAGIPVLREGNVIHLSNTSLEVAEACSGIRSLISLLTLGTVYGYFGDSRGWVRVVVAAATVPVAIVTNGLRVAGTGVGAHYFGAAVAEGFFHEFSGWLIFISAFLILLALHRVLVGISPDKREVSTSPIEEKIVVFATGETEAPRPVSRIAPYKGRGA
jgi:exosortase